MRNNNTCVGAVSKRDPFRGNLPTGGHRIAVSPTYGHQTAKGSAYTKCVAAFLIGFWLLGVGCVSVWAIGVASPFGEVVIKNAPVGTEFKLRDYVGIPYRIINTSLTPEILEVLVLNGATEQLRPGYENLPDPKWVWLSKSEFDLGPGGEGLADVFISIPRDDKYLGKKYQVQLWGRTKAGSGGRLLGTGVQSRLLIQTAYDFQTPQEAKKTAEIKASLEFYFKPSELRLSNFPTGRSISVKSDFKKSFKIVNFNEEPIKLALRSLDTSRSFALLPDGFKIGRPDWVRLEKSSLTVPPDSIGEINFSVNIPDLPENKGQKYYFIVEAVLQGYEVPVSAYGRVAVETKK